MSLNLIQILGVCKKAAQNLAVLNRISSLLEPEKKRLVFNAVIESDFSYCPLIWMFSSQRSSNLVNRIHKRYLRSIYNDTKVAHSKNFCNVIEVSILHCVKRVRIRSYSGPYFSRMRTRITPNTDSFYTVLTIRISKL